MQVEGGGGGDGAVRGEVAPSTARRRYEMDSQPVVRR